MSNEQSIVQQSRPRYYYLRASYSPKSNPIGCIITQIDRDRSTVTFALSLAHPKDKFDRKRARLIVEERIKSRPHTIEAADLSSHISILKTVMTALTQSFDQNSKRGMRSAQAWLANEIDTKK